MKQVLLRTGKHTSLLISYNPETHMIDNCRGIQSIVRRCKK